MLLPDRLAYTGAQAARFAWFYLQYRRALGAVEPAVRREDAPAGMPSTFDLLGALFDLFRRDLANIEAGRYAMPPDLFPRPDAVLSTNRRFFRDLAAVDRRRRARGVDDIFRARREGGGGRTGYPRYYLQNFHYQSDGYLSDESAALYDYQVEVLFSGGADAMRRQALVPLGEFLRTRRQGETRLLDVGCGTARFLRFARDAFPLLPLTGLDLSPNYLQHARRHMAGTRRAGFVLGAGEALPVPDASLDAVSSLFLFHELPARVRDAVVGEMARVLKPGGIVIHVDSLQVGDTARFDPLLDFFPMAYHEPYFADYVRTDLDALYARHGLAEPTHRTAFLSKVSTYSKPD